MEERKSYRPPIDKKIVDRTAMALAVREMNLESIVIIYRLMIKKMVEKAGHSQDLTKSPSDKINQ